LPTPELFVALDQAQRHRTVHHVEPRRGLELGERVLGLCLVVELGEQQVGAARSGSNRAALRPAL
jgi:hypothetical protein